MNSRPRRVLTWIKKMLSGPVRRPAPYRAKLEVLSLEDRISPAVFNPAPLAVDGAPGSLRAAIIDANGNGSASNTFYLRAGIYELSVANVGDLQENAAATGDLDLTGVGKTYIFKGAAQGGTVINALYIDRVFQILPGVTKVQFVNVTIFQGGASDDGTDGVLPDSTDAHGGGVLFEGNQLILDRTTILESQASGAGGNDGAAGQDGADGYAGFGGGIYSAGGKVTLQNGSLLQGNSAEGGWGGAGGNVTAEGAIGAGGNGGGAKGGGIYLAGGKLTMSASTIYDGDVYGSNGGAGGTGNDQLAGGTGGEGGLAQGGGIYADGATVSITKGSVLHQNSVYGGGGGNGGDSGAPHGGTGGEGGIGQGGGIFANGGTFTMTDSLVARNYAGGGFGGPGGYGSSSDFGGTGGNGGAGQGGGAYLDVAAPNISTSIFAVNKAQGGWGGDGGMGGTTGSDELFGGPGGEGGDGQGGGLFLGASNLTTKVTQTTLGGNFAIGGEGGDGGTNTSDSDDLTGGQGGQGGDGQGAGAYVAVGTLSLDRSTVSDNLAEGGEGGHGGDGGRATSTSTGGDGGNGGNGGNALGGGLFVASDGTITTVNSTLANNVAKGGVGGEGGDGGDGTSSDGTGGDGGNGGNGQGGGAYNDGGILNFYNATVAFNEAHHGAVGVGGEGDGNGNPGTSSGSGDGGGVFNDGGDVNAFSTIFSNNLVDDDGPDFFGDVDAKYCLFGSTQGTTFGIGGANLKDVDPLLGELTDNGGLTFTIAIAPDSPARNKGTNPLKLKVDQRGSTRVTGGQIDIGAYEIKNSPH